MTTQPTQTAADGSGPFLERRYSVDIEGATQAPSDLVAYVGTHMGELAPKLLAEFEGGRAAGDALRVGDEMHIRILGPWNGSVRVCESDAESFELETLEGHPEAGKIRFWAEPIADLAGGLRFVVRSRARSRDGLVAFTYATLGVGKAIQEEMWVAFCERVAEASGGKQRGDVHVTTDDRDAPHEPVEHHTR